MDRENLKRMLIRHEGLRKKPYMCPAGKLTIGVGRNLEDVGVSEEEALILLDRDLDRIEAELDHALPWWRNLTPARQEALANMDFNLGLGGLLKFKQFLAALEADDFETAAAEMLDSRWAAQVGYRATELARIMRGV